MTRVKKYSEILTAVRADALLQQMDVEFQISVATTIYIDSANNGFGEPQAPACDPDTGKGTIVGILQDREKEPGQTNGEAWQRFTYTIDGKKYSTFDADLARKFSKISDGEKIEVSLERKGKYENIVDVKLAYQPKQQRAF